MADIPVTMKVFVNPRQGDELVLCWRCPPRPSAMRKILSSRSRLHRSDSPGHVGDVLAAGEVASTVAAQLTSTRNLWVTRAWERSWLLATIPNHSLFLEARHSRSGLFSRAVHQDQPQQSHVTTCKCARGYLEVLGLIHT